MKMYFRIVGAIELVCSVVFGAIGFGYHMFQSLQASSIENILMMLLFFVIYALFAPMVGLFLLSYANILERLEN